MASSERARPVLHDRGLIFENWSKNEHFMTFWTLRKNEILSLRNCSWSVISSLSTDFSTDFSVTPIFLGLVNFLHIWLPQHDIIKQYNAKNNPPPPLPPPTRIPIKKNFWFFHFSLSADFSVTQIFRGLSHFSSHLTTSTWYQQTIQG